MEVAERRGRVSEVRILVDSIATRSNSLSTCTDSIHAVIIVPSNSPMRHTVVNLREI